MKQKQAVINGLLINYYAEGDGQPIIFLHGWRSDASVWLPLFKTLVTDSYILYALDLPGFGKSETPHKPYTLHDYASIIKTFINLIPIPSSFVPIIIGHSFGARVALKYAAENPGRAAKLVLIASGGAREKTSGIAKLLAKIIKPLFAPRFMQPLRRKIYALFGAEDYIATPRLQKTFLNIINENILTIAETINLPTLLIWGEDDAVAPLAFGKKLHQAIRGSKLVVIPHAGHFCFIDQLEACGAAIAAFLQKTP